MFIQIMNRMMNEAIFHPLAGEAPTRMPIEEKTAVPSVVRPTPRRASVSNTSAARTNAAPATYQIYASAFNTAVHGG